MNHFNHYGNYFGESHFKQNKKLMVYEVPQYAACIWQLSGTRVLRTQSRYTVSRYTCRTEIPQFQRCRGCVALHPPETWCRTLRPPPCRALMCAHLPFADSGHHMPTLKPGPGPSPSVMAASSFRHFQRFFCVMGFCDDLMF